MTLKLYQRKITVNLKGASRTETLNGIEYLVCPMVILVEGVHAGSGGPILYRNSALKKSATLWDHKPVVLRHPEIDGQPISACSPDVLEKYQIGLMLNTIFEAPKLKSEAWLDKVKFKLVDNDLYEKVLLGEEVVEVSTGTFMEEDDTAGIFANKAYGSEATILRPDHLALLPDSVGACSVACGCGLNVNESHPIANQKSWNDIMRDISSQLDTRFGYNAWIKDVYDTWFVYSYNGLLWKLGYTATDLATTISTGNPVQVYYVTQYKMEDGSIVGNSSINLERYIEMDRNNLVSKLISNHGWKEDQRKFLMDMKEEDFKTIANMIPKEPVPVPTPAPAPAPTANTGTPSVVPVAQTLDDLLKTASPQLRAVINNSMDSWKHEQDQLIAIIVANKKNKLTESVLRDKEPSELRAIAMLAMPDAPVDNAAAGTPPVNGGMNYVPPIYIGAQGAPPPVNNAVTETALVFPSEEARKEKLKGKKAS